MKVRVKWVEDVCFMGQSGSGHAVIMDGPPEMGGKNLGIRPMEMLLLGAGGCTAFDVLSMLKKARQPVQDCSVEIEADRAETAPKVFTEIRLHYRLTGHGLKVAQVERAIKLSAEKYCSATLMLGKSAKITHDYEIVDSES